MVTHLGIKVNGRRWEINVHGDLRVIWRRIGGTHDWISWGPGIIKQKGKIESQRPECFVYLAPRSLGCPQKCRWNYHQDFAV